MTTDPALTAWLLDTDPTLRWQVERHLGVPDWEKTRALVATEGFGARLLAHQDPDGQWAGGAYFPSDMDWENPNPADEGGQPYTATTWALNTLREWGLEASVLQGTAEKLEANAKWEYNDLPYWGGEVDCCINAFTLANGTWLGADVSSLPQWFLDHQMEDGGWNCMWEEDGSTRSSFISTLNSLKGILYWERATGDTLMQASRHTAEEYLLVRRALYRLTTGELVAPWVDKLAYPFRWFYNALNVLDYFREIDRPDPRLADAVELVRSQRQPDGTWLQARRHPGRVWFEVDVPAGEPSPWLTFYASRVLEWWDSSTA